MRGVRLMRAFRDMGAAGAATATFRRSRCRPRWTRSICPPILGDPGSGGGGPKGPKRQCSGTTPLAVAVEMEFVHHHVVGGRARAGALGYGSKR